MTGSTDLLARSTCPIGGSGGDGSAGCYVQYKTTGAYLNKCGLPEEDWNENFPVADPPRFHLYHQRLTQESFSQHFYTSETTTNDTTRQDCCDSGCVTSKTITVGAGSSYHSYQESRNAIHSELETGPLCTATETFSGLWSYTDESQDTHHYSGTACDGQNACLVNHDGYFTYGLTAFSATPALVQIPSGDFAWRWVASTHNVLERTGCDSSNNYTNDTTTASTNVLRVPGANYPWLNTAISLTHSAWTLDPSSEGVTNASGTYTVDVSNEYTDGELRANIMAGAPPYPAGDQWWYTPNAYDFDILGTIAYSAIDDSHTGCPWWFTQAATLQKMKFRFAIPDPQGQAYLVTWNLITWDTSTGQVDTTPGSTIIYDSSDPTQPSYSGEFEADAPYWDNSRNLGGGLVVTWVDDVSVSVYSAGTGPVAGSGPIGGAIGHGCTACGAGDDAPDFHKKWGGFYAEFSMGQVPFGYSATPLRVTSLLPSTNLATPAGLSYPATNPYVETVIASGVIRQVYAPQALADVVTDDAFTYEIRYYLPAQVGAKVGGIYQVSGTPFVTWTIHNPDASTITYNRLQITETRGSDVRVYNYIYTASSGSWKIDYPGGVREEEWTVSTVTNGTSATVLHVPRPGYIRTVSQAVRVPGGPDQFKVQRIYQRFSWGEGLVQETFGPGANPITTTYSYDPNVTLMFHAPPITQVNSPDGSWQLVATRDGYGRASDVFSTFNNSAINDLPNARETRYSFGDQASVVVPGSGDNGAILPDVPRQVLEFAQGIEVSRRFTAFPSAGVRIDVRCPMPGVNWNDPGNLFTTNRYYTNGPNLGRVKSTVRPDGTVQTFDYAVDPTGNFMTNMTASGQPDSTFSYVIDGTTNCTVLNVPGNTVLAMTADVAMQITLSQATSSAFDSFGRPTAITYLDGTQDQIYYACCGVDNTVDRDGVVTQYTYDAGKRQVASTRLGITTTNVLDAKGNVVQTIRIGSDGSPMTLSSSALDLAGRLIGQTNALGGGTGYGELTTSSGQIVRITTNPDLGTRFETNYLDGRLASVGGTAVSPEQYYYGVEPDPDNGTRREFTLDVKLSSSGAGNEWIKTYTDGAGRMYKTLYAAAGAPYPSSQSIFNLKGQLSEELDPDQVATLYGYSLKGELEYTAVDMDRDGLIGTSGTDRITRTTSGVGPAIAVPSIKVRRTVTSVWTANGVNSPLVISINDVSVDGLRTWTFTPAGTNQTSTVYAGGGYRYFTNTAPDGSYSLSAYQNGLLTWVGRFDPSNQQLSRTTYGYDSHGRQNTATDARNGTTAFTFNAADQIVTTTTPVPGGGPPAQTTTNYYDTSLRAWKTTQPDGTSVTNEFYPTGMLKRTYGSRTYPVGYGYDAQGRMLNMTNWGSFASGAGARVTTWNYDQYRGWLASKAYADGLGCHFAGENQPRSCGSKPATPRCLSSYHFWFSDQALSFRRKLATSRAETS